MDRKILRTAFTIITFLSFCLPAVSQTRMISAGIDLNGNAVYREVFEYDFVEEKPSFPGGEVKLMEFINSNRSYPREAYDRGIQGRVTCSFIVNEDGHVSNIELLKRVHSLIDCEAIRIFGIMPPWIPGRIHGIAVPVRVIRSVRFQR